MKIKRFSHFGLPAVLLALGLVVSASLALAGCGEENGSVLDPPPNEDVQDKELNLPEMTEEEKAKLTGQETIAETVSDPNMPLTLAEVVDEATGVTFSIADGEFTFTLPENPVDALAWNANYPSLGTMTGTLFGEYVGAPDGYTYQGAGVTIVNSEGETIAEKDATVTFSMVERFRWSIRNSSYGLNREAYVSNSNNSHHSKIVYIYASEDVTLSRDEKVLTNEYDNPKDTNWDAVNLELKAGWNLVQIDTRQTWNASDYTYTKTVTVKIADKNVPWTLGVYVAPPNKMVRLTNIPHAQLEKGTNQNGNPRLGVLVMETGPEAGTAPTGVVAFMYQTIQNTSGEQGDMAIVSAHFSLYELAEWPPASLTTRWTGTGDYYVALIPFISDNGAADVPKLENGKVYAGEDGSSAIKVNFNDDELPYENSSMVLELSYNDFIALNFSDTE
ncbi:MAG: hypothetical protein LBL31_03990 [Spirochaetaceae bacterium]|jgi:hypothetical protein|nr:hypothetical protein [Spirochaetaceae bacterium]